MKHPPQTKLDNTAPRPVDASQEIVWTDYPSQPGDISTHAIVTVHVCGWLRLTPVMLCAFPDGTKPRAADHCARILDAVHVPSRSKVDPRSGLPTMKSTALLPVPEQWRLDADGRPSAPPAPNPLCKRLGTGHPLHCLQAPAHPPRQS